MPRSETCQKNSAPPNPTYAHICLLTHFADDLIPKQTDIFLNFAGGTSPLRRYRLQAPIRAYPQCGALPRNAPCIPPLHALARATIIPPIQGPTASNYIRAQTDPLPQKARNVQSQTAPLLFFIAFLSGGGVGEPLSFGTKERGSPTEKPR